MADNPDKRQQLACITLVELLAYQLASPVRWIQTQDLLFKHTVSDSLTMTPCVVRMTGKRFIINMRTLLKLRQSGPAISIEDVPIQSVDILLVVIAQKLKTRVDEIPLSKKIIKDLVGGKSTMQNEISGDLQQEFASAPEKGEELPLEELGSALGTGFNSNLGKYLTGLVSRLVGGKMPIKSYLAKTWGLDPMRSDAVPLLGTTLEPPKRLSSEAEAKAWLDNAALICSQRVGIHVWWCGWKWTVE